MKNHRKNQTGDPNRAGVYGLKISDIAFLPFIAAGYNHKLPTQMLLHNLLPFLGSATSVSALIGSSRGVTLRRSLRFLRGGKGSHGQSTQAGKACSGGCGSLIQLKKCSVCHPLAWCVRVQGFSHACFPSTPGRGHLHYHFCAESRRLQHVPIRIFDSRREFNKKLVSVLTKG